MRAVAPEQTCCPMRPLHHACPCAGGIRGSFAVLKKLLQDDHGVTDLPEHVPAPAAPGVQEEQAAEDLEEAAAAGGPPHVAQPSGATLTVLADYVVYQELVARILQLSDPRHTAKALAVCLTLALVSALITLLQPLTTVCAAARGMGSLQGVMCVPLVVLAVPDSLAQVLGALLLVAVANKLLLLGVTLASAAMR